MKVVSYIKCTTKKRISLNLTIPYPLMTMYTNENIVVP